MSSGFEILAFPCNQFGGQEPGTNEEIVQLACTRFKAEYSIFDKVNLHTVLISFVFVFSKPKGEKKICLTFMISYRTFQWIQAFSLSLFIYMLFCCLWKGRPGAVVRAVSLSHQVVGSKQPLRGFCGGKACLGFSLPQTPLMWEPPALGLPFFLLFCC